ncbi:Peptidyl-prolyl cis-trans isomerase FKBP65 [Camellia lanceoleosa]|uniref:Peptidyl-prolyl cis-trans isomerase FKBP65 n=1 Tax=Camellia lanceoleosa TaxID=1840588 RepID=A0ACC0H0Z3_9ERIC|nr:Peptidyl-prolyl cis-trans isomerase FKBP65 [Camellia lanceoleosa]
MKFAEVGSGSTAKKEFSQLAKRRRHHRKKITRENDFDDDEQYVELVSFVKEKESWDMNTQEKIKAAGKKKEEGNALFKVGKYAKASKRYEKAAKYIEHDTSCVEMSSIQLLQRRIQLL